METLTAKQEEDMMEQYIEKHKYDYEEETEEGAEE